MERVVVVVISATTLIAYMSGSPPNAAVYSGLFWGAVVWAVMWLRERWRARA